MKKKILALFIAAITLFICSFALIACKGQDDGVDNGETNKGQTSTDSGDTGNGDTSGGDNGSGDAGNGDTSGGDNGSGDAGNGDTSGGNNGSGDAGNGDAGSGDSGSGDIGNGDTGSGNTGDTNSGEITGADWKQVIANLASVTSYKATQTSQAVSDSGSVSYSNSQFEYDLTSGVIHQYNTYKYQQKNDSYDIVSDHYLALSGKSVTHYYLTTDESQWRYDVSKYDNEETAIEKWQNYSVLDAFFNERYSFKIVDSNAIVTADELYNYLQYDEETGSYRGEFIMVDREYGESPTFTMTYTISNGFIQSIKRSYSYDGISELLEVSFYDFNSTTLIVPDEVINTAQSNGSSDGNIEDGTHDRIPDEAGPGSEDHSNGNTDRPEDKIEDGSQSPANIAE